MQLFSPAAEQRLGIMYEQATALGVPVYGESAELLQAWFPDAEVNAEPAFPELPWFAIVSDEEFRRAVIEQLDPPDPAACDFVAREVRVDPDDDEVFLVSFDKGATP